jgi:hypothetical protein
MAEIIVPDSIRVLMPNGRVSPMKLETYLAGAVAMAIGATAPLEALKAQAVASRTYTARAKRHGEQYADVCVHAHCQKWKRVDPIVAPEVFRAVSETWGTVATFNGELIDVFFFEHCAGKTRDAEEMAMPSQPYLHGVDCPCGFTEMKGHGVGMCQRGAIVLARQGASFRDILAHYFQNVEIVQTHADAAPVARPETPAQKKPRAAVTPKKSPAAPTVTKPAGPAPDQFSALLQSLNAAVGAPAPDRPPSTKSKSAADRIPPAVGATTSPIASPAVNTPASMGGEVSSPQQSTPAIASADPAPTAVPPLGVIHVDNLPGQRMIAGCLSRAGVEIEIENAQGWKMKVYSGSAAHYGEGGFEVALAEDGYCTVHVEDRIIELNIRGETVFLREEFGSE